MFNVMIFYVLCHTLSAEDSNHAFNMASDAFHEKDYTTSAVLFLDYLDNASPSTDNYGWGQFLLAESLYHLHFNYAASVYYYLVAKTRTQPEFLFDSLRRLQEMTTAYALGFDDDLLYTNLIDSTEFGVLPNDLESFMHYRQGLKNYTQNFLDWGNRHFSMIQPDSSYTAEAIYVQAVSEVVKNHDQEAMEMFQKVIDHHQATVDIKNKAYLSQARLLFEQKKYPESIDKYNRMQQIALSFEEAQVFTEKAWAYYYMKDYAKALGLLHSLRAPSYDVYFFAENYFLSALIFKELCYYLPAKDMTRNFYFKYNKTIEQLKQRVPFEKINLIRRAAMTHSSLEKRTKFLKMLNHEYTKINKYPLLRKKMVDLYQQEINHQTKIWQQEFLVEAEKIALDLLNTVEQINLIDYEIGLSLNKPYDDNMNIWQHHEKFVKQEDHIYYEFDNEYWNQELNHYQYVIKNRCISER